LNTDGYYDPILAFLEKASNEKFLSASFREHIHFESSPEALMARLTGHTNRKEGSRQNQITPERM
ncbi:MAG TPA: LOG family protein, partial [Leptospiraceae bacterium]|nr:LOG family protein [Leptospiraceae bacterium]